MLSSRTLAHISKSAHGLARFESTLSQGQTAKEFKVVLDNGTLYVDQAVAEALGWSTDRPNGVPLTLSGWQPKYFAIARTGTDNGKSKSIVNSNVCISTVEIGFLPCY